MAERARQNPGQVRGRLLGAPVGMAETKRGM